MNQSIVAVACIVLGLLSGVAATGCAKSAQHERVEANEARDDSARLQSGEMGAKPVERSREMRNAKGFVQNIETLTKENRDFRRVVYTAKNVQLVLMAIPPGDHIGLEVHDVDQFFRVETGKGEVVINDVRTPVEDGFAIVVPAGAQHDLVNTGTAPLKLYTLYAPPHHRDGVSHRTRADAEKDQEHFDGKTTE